MNITPDKQNIDTVFATTSYYIDFYQRDYRWTHEPINCLLDDIFFKFNEEYKSSKGLEPSPEVITERYPWYYLNTYVTNEVKGRVYIVDGQQRLTTLSLILIKLYHLTKEHDSNLIDWVKNKIASSSGYEKSFYVNHVDHVKAQSGIYDGDDLDNIDVSSGITAENMVKNYKIISAYIDKQITDKHALETFIFYFLLRLVLINLEVAQTDVSMVFEVINDRGVKLKPYEILKGKLLGQIDKIELDKDDYNGLWERQALAINSFKVDELDSFFRYYLKAKYVETRAKASKFEGDYHRVMFSNELNSKLGLLHNASNVKRFLKEDFVYYSDLYAVSYTHLTLPTKRIV